MLRRPGRLALIGSLVVALAGAWTGGTFAAFTSPQGSPGNTVTAAPDWRAPAIGTGGVGKASGPLGVARDNDTVYMFLNVTETGNPASGVANVTASAYVPAYNQTIQFPMSAGSWTVRGQTFNYRSDPVVVPNGFGNQTLTVDVTATDNAGNSDTASFPVVFDNTAPTATNIQTGNGGGTNGLAQAGDTIVYSFSEAIDPYTIVNNWNGTSPQAMRVRVINGGAGNDTVQLWNPGGTAQLPVGTINLGRNDYSSVGTTAFNSSTMVLSGSTLTVTLGGAPTGGTLTQAGGNGSMIWTPVTTATDLAGNAMSNAPRTETGTDRDF